MFKKQKKNLPLYEHRIILNISALFHKYHSSFFNFSDSAMVFVKVSSTSAQVNGHRIHMWCGQSLPCCYPLRAHAFVTAAANNAL